MPIIYSKLRSVIRGRRLFLEEFERFHAACPDPDVKADNDSHRVFVETLEQGYDILGGNTWEQALQDTENVDYSRSKLLANRFSVLALEVDGEDADESDVDDRLPTIRKTQKRQSKKGKGKGGKQKGKTTAKSGTSKVGDIQPDLPWESYRIIEEAKKGETSKALKTDYQLAAYEIARKWIELRFSVQDIWAEVVHEGVNSAVAGAITKLAVAVIKRTWSAIFIEFPGNESFDAIIQTIGRGLIDNELAEYSRMIKQPNSDDDTEDCERTQILAVREGFLIHTYSDLLDFLYDFQKNRTGKPTKAMAAQLGTWDPELDLRSASVQQRLSWRRIYTINWLYELVNNLSSVAIQWYKSRAGKPDLEKIDWFTSGPWGRHPQLYGLQEFAAEMATLAFQKPGVRNHADVRHRVTPHLLFELACLVDTMCVSRGWSIYQIVGHWVIEPPKDFRATRDLETFLDGPQSRRDLDLDFVKDMSPEEFHDHMNALGLSTIMSGYKTDDQTRQLMTSMANSRSRNGGLGVLRTMHKVETSPNMLSEPLAAAIGRVRTDLKTWLGQSVHQRQSDSVPPSRFAHTSANGLFDYSPYLCAVGLIEALQITYRCGIAVWEQWPEAMLLAHLHHMLVKKGYLSPSPVLAPLEVLFSKSFFGADHTSDVPELVQDDYIGTLLSCLKRRKTDLALRRARGATSVEHELEYLLGSEPNVLSNKNKSLLVLLQNANWDPEQIPISELPMPSFFLGAKIGLRQRDGIIDEDDELLRRWKLRRPDQEHDFFSKQTDLLFPKDKIQDLKKSTARSTADNPENGASLFQRTDKPNSILNRRYLGVLRQSIDGDVSGGAEPYAGINFFLLSYVQLMGWWFTIEDALSEKNNKLFARAQDGREFVCGSTGGDPRVRLTMLALKEQDDECLKTIAEVMSVLTLGLDHFLYWDEPLDMELIKKRMDQKHEREGKIGNAQRSKLDKWKKEAEEEGSTKQKNIACCIM